MEQVAGTVLREARLRAGLSQVELGRRAGVTQSVVSAYESGGRQPSIPTLARLVAAAGLELDIHLSEERPEPAGKGVLGGRLRRHRAELLEILARYGMVNPRLFGSVARGEDGEGSDVDLLVDVPGNVGLLTLGRCQAELEALLGARVDLVAARDLKDRVAEEVLAEAVAV